MATLLREEVGESNLVQVHGSSDFVLRGSLGKQCKRNSAKYLHSNNTAVCAFIPFRLWANNISREKKEQLTQKFGSRFLFQ